MARYIINLEEAHAALEASNGALVPAAKALGVPPHTLQTFIDANAELQAITRNRKLETIDVAQEVVLAHLKGDIKVAKDRVESAWKALINGLPDEWSPRSKVDVNSSRSYYDMSEKELMELLKGSPELLKLAKEVGDDKPVSE